jgi:hypothetical protein
MTFVECKEVKPLSPHHRLTIALHSPEAIAETGLCVRRPERNARKSRRRVARDTFSGPVFDQDLRDYGDFEGLLQ